MYRVRDMAGSGLHPVHGASAVDQEREIGRKTLVNRLNYLNFKDGTLLVNLQHPRYDHIVSFPARPQPCLGGSLECFWEDSASLPENLSAYTLESFLITDENRLLLVKPRLVHIDSSSVSFALPETCSEIHLRSTRRYDCQDIKVQLLQNGTVFHGQLINFTPTSFQVEVVAHPPQTFRWINQDASAVVIFTRGSRTLYSAACRFVKKSAGQQRCTLLLAPMANRIQRFKNKNYRSSRLKLKPSPNAMFIHPLTDKQSDLKVHDLSGSGLSILERKEDTLLMSGLMIPDLELVFGDGCRIVCQAQVVYQRPLNVDGRSMKLAGLAFLDMELPDHVRLMSILQQVWDENAYLCNRVDPDALWKFFFETGFIYPQKYVGIEANKQEYRETYQKLYTENPEIARHFIYQENSAILGHMAMLRMYSNSWLIHHHAAIKEEAKRAGLMVLHQIGRSINDSHSLYSAHMNYVMCYYQPENRFPKRMFGGVAEHYQNRKGCSIDAFAYFHFRQNFERPWNLSAPWSLTRTERHDLQELENFYERESGGLMLQALDLIPETLESVEMQEKFQSLGFKRERYVYSLKKNGGLKALILINLSDLGLNFSSLTNSIKVIVVDQDDTPRETLNLMLALLTVKFELEEPPVLLFPQEYAQANGLAFEKSYQMWVLNCQDTDPYFEYCEKIFKKN